MAISSLSLTFFFFLYRYHILVWSFLGFIFNSMFYLVPVLKYCLFKKNLTNTKSNFFLTIFSPKYF